MKKDLIKPSLLPFLQCGANNFKLEISLGSEAYPTFQAQVNAVSEISEAGPFARLLKGHIMTDAGSVIKQVFLLQQSDNYFSSGEILWPVTNSDLDRLWQDAYEKYSERTPTSILESATFILADQINEEGRIIPFQSLFYCIQKETYFHPPCPKCGNCLELCKNDDLLESFNLSAYSKSLRRYLYCPECAAVPEQFVCYSILRDVTDPAVVKDQFSLVNEIGNLVATGGPLSHSPCPECEELHGCYGDEKLADTRIVPYSFYPFHLLIFDAPSLNATDFIAYLSGATLDEMTDHLTENKVPGRINCLKTFRQRAESHSPYIFARDGEKTFLEILYLKLSFLGELMQLILSDPHSLSWPDFSFSLERVWVKLADQSRRLPMLWNFNLEILDIGFHAAGKPHLSKYPPVYGLHFMGNVWFYVLLANKQHPIEWVHAKLDQYLVQAASGEKMSKKFDPQNEADAIFSPANIYWNPREKLVNPDWLEIWGKALDLGESLLAAGMNAGASWSADLFWKNFEITREEIKTQLFGPSPSTLQKKSYANGQAISAILTRIATKWQTDLNRASAEPFKEIRPQPQDEPRDSEIMETVILSPDNAAGTGEPPRLPADQEETLILQPGPDDSGNDSAAESQDEDIIQETVILSPGTVDSKLARPEPAAPDTGEDDMPETILISPSAQDQGGGDAARKLRTPDPSSGDSNISAFGSDLFNAQKTAGLKKKGLPEDDDDLTETVILRPDTRKDSKSSDE